MLPCAQLMGVSSDATQLLHVPLGDVFGSAYSDTNALPAGLNRSAGILFPGNGAPVSGSIGMVAQLVSVWLKSPLRSASVGTNCVRTVPRFSRFHSADPKKCSLSLIRGPPKL